MEHQRDQVSWAAARAIGTTSQLLLSDLSTATTAARVACCLRTAVSLFSIHQVHTSADQSGPKAAAPQGVTEDDLLQRCYEQLQPHAAMLGWDQLSSLFYQCQFSAWAAGVLTVAAGEWLPRLQGAERDELWRLVLDTFMLCPACHALSSLMEHLSAVSPQALGHNSTITALAADSAAELLLQRFLLPDSPGMQQLLAACDAGTEQQLTSCAAMAQQLVEHLHQAQQLQCVSYQDSVPAKSAAVQQIRMSEGQMQEAAALLAALPDRLQVLQAAVPQLPHIAQSSAVTMLVQQCMEFIANSLEAPAATQTQQHPSTHHNKQNNSCDSDTPGSTAAVGTTTSSSSSFRVGGGSGGSIIHALATPGAVHLTAMLLQKLVTRGHGSTVAAALLQLTVQGLMTASSSKGYPTSGPAPATAAAGSGHGVGQGFSSTEEGRQQAHAAGQQVVCAQGAGRAVQSNIPGLHQVLLLLGKEPVGAAAAEKLFVRILQQSSREIQPQQQPQQQQEMHGKALQALLCPLLQVSAHYRSIALNKLLLGHTLPTSVLQQLLQLLAACTPSLLPEAAAALAQCWCDNSTIMHVSVSQQAYITAALVACLQELPKGLLDPALSLKAAAGAGAGAGAGTAAAAAELQVSTAIQQALGLQPYTGIQPEQASVLLPSIIQGVSTRLGSPSPAIRLQAMRVGRAFAVKLDPSKPMFDDAGPLELMGEEQWPGALQSQQPAQQLVQQQIFQGQQDNVQLQQQEQQHCEAAVADSSDDVSFKALARLAAATEGPDSDDEDTGIHPGHAAASTPQHQPTGSGSSRTQPYTSAAPHSSSTASPSTGLGSGVVCGDWDAASDADSEGSASSLVAFDLQEDLSAEQWWGPDGLGPTDSKALGLRAVAAALRKQDDMAGALDALKKVEVLVRAEPDELPVVAPELARALIHCKVTQWADTPTTAPAQHSTTLDPPQAQPHTTKGLSSNAEIQRQRALVAVLSLSPLTSGDTVIAELYSPNLDQHQRVMILDGLASAAVEMSDPRKAPELALQGPQKAPELLPPAPSRSTLSSTPQPHALTAAQQSSAGSSSSSSSRHPDGTAGSAKHAAAPGMVEASSRVWGKVSLQKQAQEAANPNSSSKRTFRNRFAPVALRWAAALLQQCDVKQQGIDLFGRDSLLLGRLLTVLGAFVEAAAETPAAMPLCVGLLELLKAQEVSGHKEAYVRRSALVAASQVVRHLPPARLAGALVGRRVDVQDEVLVERLQWLMSWAQQMASSDVDQHCKLLAAGCVAWHMELSDGAMAVLEHLPEPEGPSLAAVGPGGKRGSSNQDADIKVQLPTVERLVLS